MIYNTFQEKELSRLGFGMMRLPVKEDGSIDQEHVNRMVDYAIAHGVNYFDTAYPYHGGKSEIAAGIALGRYPRESYCLATKYPGHQRSSFITPERIFPEQLEKCGVDYFDFYLLHNVNEASLGTYLNESNGIMEYFLEQRRTGKIRHLGFSCHANPENLKLFLDRYGDEMEFCQIQLNYLDWTLQNAKLKYEMLTERGIPVWVMEPVRGGKLASLSDTDTARLKALRPEESIPAWCFRWLQGLENVKMILSGMSCLEQMEDNVRTFEECRPLSEQENETLQSIAEGMKNSVPCTGCRYCCDGCPMGLNIPTLISSYNQVRFAPENTMQISIFLESLPDEKKPSACIGCGACMHACPQNIEVPKILRSLAEAYETMPKWSEICRQREEAARAMQKNKE